MPQEMRQCQNCKNRFVIEPEDFDFYKKIDVPPPTFCPKCRLERRLLFWNAVNLYKRPCDLCKKFNISCYPADAPYTVYCPTCWWSDKWDPFEFGKEYDFKRPFFEQLDELWHKAPLLGLSVDLTTAESSSYNHDCGYLKNCYLMFNALECEDSAIGYYLGQSESVFDCCAVVECNFGFDAMHSFKTSRCVGSREQISESIECLFCRDCQNCQNCFASANLKNKKYWAWNKPLTKEEYFKEVGKYDLGSYSAYRKLQKKAEEHWRTQIPKSEYNEFAVNCTGSNVFNSKNVRDSIEVVSGGEDCRYLDRIFGPVKNCYDISQWGANLSLSYEGVVVGEDSTLLKFCCECGMSLTDAQYSKLSTGGSHHFGCVSMKKGSYCILNRQYSKEEYEVMVPKVVEHMNSMPYASRCAPGAEPILYRYGEFFPPEFSPFAYNTTLAQNFFPMTRADAVERNYSWREIPREEYKTTIEAGNLPDHIRDAAESVLEETVACENCGRGYRVSEMELRFCRQMNLPLFRRCPFCRINEKINLWVKSNERNARRCAGCGATIESKYREEERREVFCRNCYLARIE